MSRSTDLPSGGRKKRDPRRESTAIFSALLRTSEQEKGLLDENELAVGDEDIIIPLHKASLVLQGVKSVGTGCLVVEPDTEADMLEHDALHDTLALERQMHLNLEVNEDEDERIPRSSMLLAIPEEQGLGPGDDHKLLLSTGGQTPEGAEDSWLVPVKRDDIISSAILHDEDIKKKQIEKDGKSNKDEEALIKAIREDASCVTNIRSGSHVGAASIDTNWTKPKNCIEEINQEMKASNVHERPSKSTTQCTGTRVPARPPSRLKPPSSRSNFFSETRDIGGTNTSFTAASKSGIESTEIYSSIKRPNQSTTTTSSDSIGGHKPVVANGKPASRPKKFGSSMSKGSRTGQITCDQKTRDQSKQVSISNKSRSSSHTGPMEAKKVGPMGSGIDQPQENDSILGASDLLKSPSIHKTKMEEGSHGKESPATARLRWLDMNPHLAFGGGSKLANTPPKDDQSKHLRKTAEQLHFEAWGNNL